MTKKIIFEIKNSLSAAILALLVSILISQFTQLVTVSGKSMEGKLQDNDKLIISKIAYNKTSPQYKDIVIINKNGYKIIKRVIGVPGDHIKITSNKVFINGEELIEEYINNKEKIENSCDIDITLKDDEIFVMGDNRNYSLDSRDSYIGIINYKKNVIGKVLFSVYPFKEI